MIKYKNASMNGGGMEQNLTWILTLLHIAAEKYVQAAALQYVT